MDYNFRQIERAMILANEAVRDLLLESRAHLNACQPQVNKARQQRTTVKSRGHALRLDNASDSAVDRPTRSARQHRV
jgi:hypothetical protein